MRAFVYNGLPSRVVFGPGAVAQLPAEVARLGAKRVLLLSTPGRAGMVAAVSKNLPIAGVFDKVVMHTPLEAANEALVDLKRDRVRGSAVLEIAP